MRRVRERFFFWSVTPYSLVGSWCSDAASIFRIQATSTIKMETACNSVTSVFTYKTTRYHNSEDSLKSHRYRNLETRVSALFFAKFESTIRLVVTSCSWVEFQRCFRVTYCLPLQGRRVRQRRGHRIWLDILFEPEDGGRTCPETAVGLYWTTWCYNPEGPLSS
jgi:hypothetical protein